MKQCNCHSYNKANGSTPEVVLKPPEHLIDKESICIDACVAPLIQALWDNNIRTESSCCGHGKIKPSIVFMSHMPQRDLINAKELIDTLDGRDFDMLMWKLTDVNAASYTDPEGKN